MKMEKFKPLEEFENDAELGDRIEFELEDSKRGFVGYFYGINSGRSMRVEIYLSSFKPSEPNYKFCLKDGILRAEPPSDPIEFKVRGYKIIERTKTQQ